MNKSQAKKQAVNHVFQIQQFLQQPNPRLLIDDYLFNLGITPPASNDDSFNLRLVCVDWWTRRVIDKYLKDSESKIVLSGRVSRSNQVYCSDDTFDYFNQRHEINMSYMENMLCISDEGDEIDMMKILDSSLSNPKNRRAELMVRMAGFEQYADSNGHIGMFYTITCPSKYHRFSGDGLNENYAYTPREGQCYLVNLWAKIRAKFKRDNLDPYGFRVAEPHHDGTPHWHMLLFMPRDQVDQCTAIIRDYSFCEDGDEKGAFLHRFTAKEIVKEIVTEYGIKKCSATGYIAKYISKNIGFDIDGEQDSQNPLVSDVNQRIRSWASVWGIRQFQQIGGASVTVWRELRRLKDEEIEDDFVKRARDCCVGNDWSGFLDVMGGIHIKRVDRPVQLLKKT